MLVYHHENKLRFETDSILLDQPIPEVQEAVQDWSNAGATMHYLTARHRINYENSRAKLEEEGFPDHDNLMMRSPKKLETGEYDADRDKSKKIIRMLLADPTLVVSAVVDNDRSVLNGMRKHLQYAYGCFG